MTGPFIETECVTCDLCGSDEQELLYTRLDPVTKQEFNLVECRCGMAFVNPMPTEAAIPKLYPGDYLKDKPGMDDLYARMMSFLPKREKGRLLDIGCGRGDFIAFAALSGWDVEGVDLLAWDAPQRVPIQVGDFLAMDFGEARFDVITAWAVLEHVRAPSAFFRKASTLLKPDGHFLFVVPNVAAPGMRYSCTEDVPRHLHLFTPPGVRAHLERHGMRVEKIAHTDLLYTAYPFGLVRYGLLRLRGKETRCSRYENRSVALLRNRQIRGNLRAWLSEVATALSPVEMIIDAMDLGAGVALAQFSKLTGRYGVMVVTARNR